LKSKNRPWIGSVQGAVATWSVISRRYFLMIYDSAGLTRSLPLPVLTRSKNGFGLLRQSSAAFVVCAFALVVSAQSVTPKRIVVLYWDNKEFPGNIKFEESFKTRLQLNQRQDVEYYPEYFELSRFPEEKHILGFRDLLQAKYAGRSIDVVVASAD